MTQFKLSHLSVLLRGIQFLVKKRNILATSDLIYNSGKYYNFIPVLDKNRHPLIIRNHLTNASWSIKIH